jgi:hypothetical protein
MKRGWGDFGMVADSGKAVDPSGEHVGIGQLAGRLNGATTLKGLICDHGSGPV